MTHLANASQPPQTPPLPILQEALSQPETSQLARGPPGCLSATPALPTFQLLVVEDHLDMFDVIQDFLKLYLDIECTCATTGTDALELLANRRFDAMTLDINLPDMRGSTMMVKARFQELEIPPTIVVSANPSGFITWTGERTGAIASLAKPFDISVLVDILLSLPRRDSEGTP